MEHSRKPLNLTGQRFGQLVVLGPAENIGNRTAWRCQCDCGRTITARTGHLRSGHISSCGCLRAGSPLGLTYIDGTCVEMLRAGTVRSNNTSGVPGVNWREARKKWRAEICFQGKRYYLGSFCHFEDAVQARQAAVKKLHSQFLLEYDQGAVKGEDGS